MLSSIAFLNSLANSSPATPSTTNKKSSIALTVSSVIGLFGFPIANKSELHSALIPAKAVFAVFGLLLPLSDAALMQNAKKAIAATASLVYVLSSLSNEGRVFGSKGLIILFPSINTLSHAAS